MDFNSIRGKAHNSIDAGTLGESEAYESLYCINRNPVLHVRGVGYVV